MEDATPTPDAPAPGQPSPGQPAPGASPGTSVGEGAMRVTRSAKAMPEEPDGAAGAADPAPLFFDESLMATDVPQARDGGKGVCQRDQIC